MATTYVAIATVTVGSGGTTAMTFSSIPQTYTDLLLKVSGRCSDAAYSNIALKFNSSTSGYSQRLLEGNGSTARSVGTIFTSSMWVSTLNSAGQTSNTFGNVEIYIPNYTGSNQKSISVDAVTETNATTAYAQLSAGLHTGTSAITQIDVTGDGSTFVQYSTATLYGIKNS